MRAEYPHEDSSLSIKRVIGPFLAGNIRNFFKRIELAVPVLDPKARRRIMREGLKPYLEDNVQAWEMQADGSFKRVKRGRKLATCVPERVRETSSAWSRLRLRRR